MNFPSTKRRQSTKGASSTTSKKKTTKATHDTLPQPPLDKPSTPSPLSSPTMMMPSRPVDDDVSKQTLPTPPISILTPSTSPPPLRSLTDDVTQSMLLLSVSFYLDMDGDDVKYVRYQSSIDFINFKCLFTTSIIQKKNTLKIQVSIRNKVLQSIIVLYTSVAHL